MGCGVTKSTQLQLKPCNRGNISVPAATAMRAALLIQRWYRQYVAQLEMRRRCTWNIFQSIEYSGQQDHIKLYNFFGYLMDHFSSANSQRNLVSHMFGESDVFQDMEWERHVCYKEIEVLDIYTGPHLSFPLTISNVTELVHAFKNKQKLHARYVLQLLGKTWTLLRLMPNISHVCTCKHKEITICGDLHGHLEDLLLIFYKNGFPSAETPYVFNGDFVDRGKESIEILLVLFAFLLLYPHDVHLNRGNHEDHIVNLRYGFTKEVLGKYQVHGKMILKLLQKIFSWLPLATVIDQKVLILHGGISDKTDLNVIAKLDRHRFASALRPLKSSGASARLKEAALDPDGDDELSTGRRRVQSLTHGTPLRLRQELPRHSVHSESSRTSRSVEEELRERRRLAGLSLSSDSDPAEVLETDTNEWKQIVDVLWSDPMSQNGCVPNEVRGGGCYWGPDVTHKVLDTHKLQLLIRSHECKQEGYEFCHNGRVLTIFSASNYYDVGSNRGAYIRLGPDLIPHFKQFQSSRSTRELTLRQSVGRTELSALQALRMQLFAHKSDLIHEFQEYDPQCTGVISVKHWAAAVEKALRLALPWRVLRSQLVTDSAQDGTLNYQHWVNQLSVMQPNTEITNTSLLETLYKHHSNLESIFRMIDTDHSGLISFKEFRQTWKLLSSHLQMDISDKAISDLAESIDFNKDGSIDINEFMEAFRLVEHSRAETDAPASPE
ncbi:serine/threonine-protein phosphatase with EF-hands 2 isoform X1 [Sinocyclocheilus rhinocerous]|uniref:serine/threonine-protein phosphatase with EF-hands 2 isoform X1 n=2 Tax=Sinocyclocheilus rhinocerous TaxID=307959 RepID=UPI0007B9D216|nr:PREDICTED: serine/threonine-protein phosphatase with EF-hands 2-like isoform X1 [Sinocyclocheilus rhinocerous]